MHHVNEVFLMNTKIPSILEQKEWDVHSFLIKSTNEAAILLSWFLIGGWQLEDKKEARLNFPEHICFMNLP